ncbi:Uncharacterised protein [Vibrio cholerae]|uniref:Uncharacterized protein n=1 Tax=Vibrio cholerae TaxID=666 RepID=A0A655QL43_VIBCL|nr:Uncharacterised protein [Vibrio cholerae]
MHQTINQPFADKRGARQHPRQHNTYRQQPQGRIASHF